MSFPCSNVSSDKICNSVINYCNVGFTKLHAWCECLIQNYEKVCEENKTYISLFTNLFIIFFVCLTTLLCFMLCRGMTKTRRNTPTQQSPPPYVFIHSNSPPPYQSQVKDAPETQI